MTLVSEPQKTCFAEYWVLRRPSKREGYYLYLGYDHVGCLDSSAAKRFPTINSASWMVSCSPAYKPVARVKAWRRKISAIEHMLNEAMRRYNALSPEEKAAHNKAQRDSWARAELDWPETRLVVQPR